ncbi:hypothetical protein DNTS_030436 [Danionella cerebrum]|uniref:Taste receptor type 2 n=1 Tax=Danionella cerebrum TaxID=2873325 RepID=A0A553RJ46_9TELE|nr:hypothetical protein DNTS_030436 [Danionella translucida]
MTFIEDVVFFVAIGFVGVSGNVFNFIFTLQQQVRSRSVQTVGLILDIISISNIILVLSTLGMVIGVYLDPGIWCISPYPLNLRLEIFLMMTSSFISFWAIAWLSLFYCIKVVSFTSECLISLKKNISSVINASVLLSCLFSALLFSPTFTLDLVTSDGTLWRQNSSNNLSCPSLPSFTIPIDTMTYAAAILLLLCPVPLMIMLPTSIRMVVHLCAHTLAMQKNQTQVQGSDSYLLVCKLTIALVGVYISTLFIASSFIIVRMFGKFVTYHTLAGAFSFYGGMTSVLLTASNRHLKDKLWGLLCCRKPKEHATKSLTVETGDV